MRLGPFRPSLRCGKSSRLPATPGVTHSRAKPLARALCALRDSSSRSSAGRWWSERTDVGGAVELSIAWVKRPLGTRRARRPSCGQLHAGSVEFLIGGGGAKLASVLMFDTWPPITTTFECTPRGLEACDEARADSAIASGRLLADDPAPRRSRDLGAMPAPDLPRRAPPLMRLQTGTKSSAIIRRRAPPDAAIESSSAGHRPGATPSRLPLEGDVRRRFARATSSRGR